MSKSLRKAAGTSILLAMGCLAQTGVSEVRAGAACSELTIVSWGGSYTKSQMLAYVRPFRQDTAIRTDVLDYNGGLWEIREQVDSYNVTWDIVDLMQSDVIRGCDEGLLEKIDPAILAPASDGTPAEQDFIPGSLHECGVGTVIWSTVVAFDAENYPSVEQRPETIRDFFDIDKFPGMRGLQNTPRVNLEWALIADGVPPDQVYDVLSTRQGLERAFRRLEKISQYIVWWDLGTEPSTLLADGTVVMTSAYNGRIYDAVAEKGKHFGIIWDGQVWDIAFWGIPKGTDDLELALRFISYSTEAQHLAEQAKYSAYGPVRKSSTGLIDEDVKPYLPTTGDKFANALEFDSEWWAGNEEQVTIEFESWLEGLGEQPGE